MSRLLALLVAVSLLWGCTADALSEEAAADLQQHTATVRGAAEVGDLAATTEALVQLRTALDAHHAAGGVTDARAREIAAAAEEVAALLEATPDDDAPPTPTPTEPAPATEAPQPPPPPPPPPAPDDGEDDDAREDDREEDDEDDEDDREDRDDGEDDDDGDDDGDDEEDGNDTARSRGPDGDGPPGQR